MLPPITRPSATGRTGWRAPERAKKTSIQATAMPVSTITTAVACEKNPNAMPEFRTWWIQNGPTHVDAVVERELARDDVLRQLVGGDCGERDRRRARPTASGPRQASAPRTRRARARRSRNRRERRIAREQARSTALCLSRVVDAERRPGIRLEPLRRDLLAAARARPVRAVLDALQRGVDLRQHLLRVLPERVVDLAVERCRGAVADVVVAAVRKSRRLRRRASPDGSRAGSRSQPARVRVPCISSVRKRSVSMLMSACPFYCDR